jgi:hypothetical protein
VFEGFAWFFNVPKAQVIAALAWLFNTASSSASASGGLLSYDGDGISAGGIITLDADPSSVTFAVTGLGRMDYITGFSLQADRSGGSDPVLVEYSIAGVMPDGSAFEGAFNSDGGGRDVYAEVMAVIPDAVWYPGDDLEVTVRCTAATNEAPVRVKVTAYRGAGLMLGQGR